MRRESRAIIQTIVVDSTFETFRSSTPQLSNTLRYFERCYLDSSINIEKLSCSATDSDGLIGYWVNDAKPKLVPNSTADGKPLMILCAAELESLRIQAR
ncbi:hypothetical protein IQ255_07135 [Pleurocapsales cyanobacterium LEGE 10410]|nr:hypothetical protein [Pleurocapsales cyanobacterium LEGE 10410]